MSLPSRAIVEFINRSESVSIVNVGVGHGHKYTMLVEKQIFPSRTLTPTQL